MDMKVKTLTGGIAWLLLGATMALTSPACRSFNAYCLEVVDCEEGNDEDIEACKSAQQLGQERASIFGCSTQYNILQDCVEAEADCENDRYTPEDKCLDEQAEFNSCMSDDFDGGSSTDAGSASNKQGEQS